MIDINSDLVASIYKELLPFR